MCYQQGHVDSKTVLQQNAPILNWGCLPAYTGCPLLCTWNGCVCVCVIVCFESSA